MHRLLPVALFGAGLAVGVSTASILVPRRREEAVTQASPQQASGSRALDVPPASTGLPDSVKEILALSGNPGKLRQRWLRACVSLTLITPRTHLRSAGTRSLRLVLRSTTASPSLDS